MRKPSSTALLLLSLSSIVQAQAPAVRRPIPKFPVPALTPPAGAPLPIEARLVVKFADAVRARSNADGTILSRAGADLGRVEALAARLGARFSPVIRLDESIVERLRTRARDRSRIEQPDLLGTLAVLLPSDDPAVLAAAGNAFQELAEVEFASIEWMNVPPPGDIAPPTPDLVSMQGYRGPDPGLDADYAWSQGLRGAGVRLSDCEYWWTASHEDLNDINIHPEPGQTPSGTALAFADHGTAVLGETSSVANAYGTSGIVPDAEVYTYTESSVEEGWRRLASITHAIANSRIGDVVLLEMQINGAGGDYGPAELDPAVWMVVKAGTDAGVVVVAAAGNGSQDLDSAPYAPYMAMGDSGAIIVGAGSASTSHDKLGFSTYGSRVNVQGWGGSVFTLGYGNFATYGGDSNQEYTGSFGGTSSASPFVAAACVALQGLALENCGSPLSSQELRALLIATGIPQGGGGHIGPFVDLKTAILTFPPSAFTTYCSGDGTAATCPCANPGSACHGCLNSTGGAGGRLVASGVASVAGDSLALLADGMPPTATCLYVQGASAAASGFGIVKGDGLFCLSGPYVRLGLKSSVDGRSHFGAPHGDTPVSVKGGVPGAGGTFYYQAWYRDPASFCTTSTYNYSNGVAVTWAP